MLLLRLVPRSFPRLVRSVVADAPAKKWPARTPYKRAVPAVKAAAAVVEPVAAFDHADASEEAAELDQLDLTPMHDAAPTSTSAQPAATSAPAQGIPTIQDYPTMPFPLESSVPLGQPAVLDGAVKEIDWTTSFHGLSAQPFSERAAAVLMRELKNKEIEIKPGSSSPRPLCHPADGSRWDPVPPGDPVPSQAERGVWSWRMGDGAPGRDDGGQDDGQPRVESHCWWSVRPFSPIDWH